MISTILFDIYGTLIDISTDENDPAAYDALSKWLEYKYIYLSADQLKWFYREEFARRIGTEAVRKKLEQDVFKSIIDESKPAWSPGRRYTRTRTCARCSRALS